MGKPYIRKRGSLAKGNIHTFHCRKCHYSTTRKVDIKNHTKTHD